MPQKPLTDDQCREVVALVEECGRAEAAKRLGVALNTVSSRLRVAAHRLGLSPQLAPAENPAGFSLSKSTIQLDAEGNVTQEWRRVAPTEEDLRALVETLKADTPPAPRVKLPKLRKSDTLGLLVLTDLHVGKYGWGDEVGVNYDSDTAYALGVAAVEDLLPTIADAGEVVLLVNGDHWHADNRSGTTELSGNILDMDGRYQRNLRIGIQVLVQAVEMLLKGGRTVRLVIVPGNHDHHTCIAAAEIMAHHYRQQKRVTVDTTAGVRKAIIFGQCLIAAAHGHGVKPDKWASLIPVDPVTGPHWSGCAFRYLFLGHIHSRRSFAPIQIAESTGLHVEYLPSLCGPDAWHYEKGFIGAGRSMDALLFHRDYGLQARATRDVAQIARRAGIQL